MKAVTSIFGLQISFDACNIIYMFIAGVSSRWNCCFYWKDASNYDHDDDLLNAIDTADDFSFTSRLTSGVSYNKLRYDVLTCYFTPQANLPRTGAQQILRVRNFASNSGVFSVGSDCNRRWMCKPLGFSQNRKLCLSRESFSLNLLDD